MSRQKQRIDTSGGSNLAGDNPFAALSAAGLPAATSTPPSAARAQPPASLKPGARGRLEVRRVKGGRGGKTVTEISGFAGISAPELEQLGRELKRLCGSGGTVRGTTIEIQGDARAIVMDELARRGWRSVAAGG